jgi:asparagine synthase (glutamine-hydrolysing)
MCGIAGIVSREPQGEQEISSMTMSLSHRGPDARRTVVLDRRSVALGHTRLCILDLDSRSHQPFTSADGNFILVFNGEIYNYREVAAALSRERGVTFRTTSDTEVVVEAFAHWGPEMVNRLEGMFAFVIVDKRNEDVFLFRDRMGKKPLYYYSDNSMFAFASEIKALLKHPHVFNNRKVDLSLITYVLHVGYVPEPDSIFRNIHKFPSGCWARLTKDMKLALNEYWSLRKLAMHQSPLSFNGAKTKLRSLLTESVIKRMISDVPLGAFLSGGTDSSLITAIASQQASVRLKTFSIAFENSQFDESQYARAVASHLNTDHASYVLKQREAIDILEEYLHHFDEPFADTSAIPSMLVSKLARKDVAVALTGDGGDELFSGYGAYTWATRLDHRILRVLKRPLSFMLQLSARDRLLRIAHLFEGVPDNKLPSHIFSQEQYYFSESEIFNSLLNRPTDFSPIVFPDYSKIPRNAAERQAFFDIEFYLKNDLLVKVDRASMYSSLECRSPLLDQHVVQFAMQLPFDFKVRSAMNKYILKKLLAEYLPENLINRKKWGFSIPMKNWLRKELRYLIDDYLNQKITDDIGVFNWSYIADLKKRFLNGQDYLYNRLWLLIVVHKWVKENA